MPLWLPKAAGARVAKQGAPRAARSRRHSGRGAPAHLDERAIEQRCNGGPGEVALTLAREKARTVAAMSGPAIVVGCDQTLALGERRFSKPADRAAAREQLWPCAARPRAAFRRRGVSERIRNVWPCGRRAARRCGTFPKISSRLTSMRRAAVTASVGAYQLERTGIHLFEKIEGDHFTILGLPLLPLLGHLRDEGVLAA